MANSLICRNARHWFQKLVAVNHQSWQRNMIHVSCMKNGSYSQVVCRLFPVNCILLNKMLYGDQLLWNSFQQQTRTFAKKAIVKEPKGKGKRKALLTDEELMEVIDVGVYRSELQEVIDKMKANFSEHLSLHKLIGNIDNISVKIEDDEYPLNELAKITRKNPNLVTIDMSGFPEGLKPVLRAIAESGMGVNPQQEGTTIYLPLPKITREHRERLAKSAKTLCTKCKDDIRAVQNKYIREAKKQTELSEDLVYNSQQQIMYMASECSEEAEKLLKVKQEELLPKS